MASICKTGHLLDWLSSLHTYGMNNNSECLFVGAPRRRIKILGEHLKSNRTSFQGLCGQNESKRKSARSAHHILFLCFVFFLFFFL